MPTTLWVSRIAATLVLCAAATLTVNAADKRRFSSHDFTALRSATPVAISPDGKTILFEVRSFDEKGPTKHEWHTIPASGGTAAKLDLPEKFTPWGYTKDGALFGEVRIDDQTQFAIVPLAEGRPTLTFALPRGSHAPAISPDGAKIAVLSDSRQKDKEDQHTVVENDESSLYVFDLRTNSGAWWCPDLRDITEFAWSKDSNRLAVATQLPKLGNHDVHSTLNVCAASGARQLADVPTATAGVAWSADEEAVVFASAKAPTPTAE